MVLSAESAKNYREAKAVILKRHDISEETTGVDLDLRGERKERHTL